MKFDFHFHSDHSDGSHPPEYLLNHAAELGIGAVSLTDHDTVAGLSAAAAEAERFGINFVNGVEISGKYEGGTLHVLGYGFDPENRRLLDSLSQFSASRDARNAKIVGKLQSFGIEIEIDELLERFGGENRSVGRPHIAKLLVEKKAASNNREAFERYLGYGGAAYEDKEIFTAGESLEIIHASGGKAFIAHPVSLNLSWDDLKAYLKSLKDEGLDGVEVYNGSMNNSATKRLKAMAEELQLETSGGSDFHGEDKSNALLGQRREHKPLDSSEISFDFFKQMFLKNSLRD